MRTVYVMGAGASKHVGYPLISGMSKQLFEWMAAYPNDMFRSSADFLVERFGTDPDIEDVITEIDSLIDSNMKDRLQHFTLVTARQQLFDSLREWFRELHLRPAFAYAKFADEVIQAGDVVITFNYDDSLERELRRAGKWDVALGYGMAAADKRACDMILRSQNTKAKVEIVCGSQGKRVENDFRNAGYEDVIADVKGAFEDWVERRAQEETRKEDLKVDQVVRALDGGTPVMKLPQ